MALQSRQRDSKIRIGEANQLHFFLSWHGESTTEGFLSAFLGGENIWGGDEGFRWTLGEIVVFLVRGLDSLRSRQAFPFNSSASSPFDLKRWLEDKWPTYEKSVLRQLEEEWFDFENKHNLARAFQGAHPRALYLLKEGNLFRLWFEKRTSVYPYDKTLKTLVELGDAVYARAKGDANFLGIYPEVNRWPVVRASVTDRSSAIALSLNVDVEDVSKLTQGRDAAEYLETDAMFDSELMAAARMTSGVLTLNAIAGLIIQIKQVAHRKPTRELNALSEEALNLLKDHVDDKPYHQGYVLANWFREVLPAPRSPREKHRAFDVLIESWNVRLKELTCNEQLDAIAVWGPNHGPAILVNTEGLHNKQAGRRSTLAHEICHLLVDRQNSIPFGEVLGGVVPHVIEARAKAFAAELILPRNEAVKLWYLHYNGGLSAKDCVREIMRSADTTMHITAHQLLNSGKLDKRSFGELNRYFSSIQISDLV